MGVAIGASIAVAIGVAIDAAAADDAGRVTLRNETGVDPLIYQLATSTGISQTASKQTFDDLTALLDEALKHRHQMVVLALMLVPKVRLDEALGYRHQQALHHLQEERLE